MSRLTIEVIDVNTVGEDCSHVMWIAYGMFNVARGLRCTDKTFLREYPTKKHLMASVLSEEVFKGAVTNMDLDELTWDWNSVESIQVDGYDALVSRAQRNTCLDCGEVLPEGSNKHEGCTGGGLVTED